MLVSAVKQIYFYTIFIVLLHWKLYVHGQEVGEERCSLSRKLHLPSKRRLISKGF